MSRREFIAGAAWVCAWLLTWLICTLATGNVEYIVVGVVAPVGALGLVGLLILTEKYIDGERP